MKLFNLILLIPKNSFKSLVLCWWFLSNLFFSSLPKFSCNSFRVGPNAITSATLFKFCFLFEFCLLFLKFVLNGICFCWTLNIPYFWIASEIPCWKRLSVPSILLDIWSWDGFPDGDQFFYLGVVKPIILRSTYFLLENFIFIGLYSLRISFLYFN